MNKTNVTHTFHGGEVLILRSAIEGDRIDYRAMLARELLKSRRHACVPYQATLPAALLRDELLHGHTQREVWEFYFGNLT